jgi:hypothetical protein
MAWTAPRTWVATNVLTAAQLNTDVRDNMLWLGTRKGFKIRRAAAQVIGTGALTAVSFDTEDSDTDAFGAVAATTYTIPTGLDGMYSITANVVFATAAGTTPYLRIIAGGISHTFPIGTATSDGTGTVTVPLVATNTIGVSVFHNQGANVNVTVTLWATFVGR